MGDIFHEDLPIECAKRTRSYHIRPQFPVALSELALLALSDIALVSLSAIPVALSSSVDVFLLLQLARWSRSTEYSLASWSSRTLEDAAWRKEGCIVEVL